MIDDFVNRGARALSPTDAHDEFLELCALSTTGELSQAEQKKLDQHLAVCPSCRQALQQYESVVDQAIPAIAAHEDPESANPGPGWSEKEAEQRFLHHLAGRKEFSGSLGWRKRTRPEGQCESQRCKAVSIFWAAAGLTERLRMEPHVGGLCSRYPAICRAQPLCLPCRGPPWNRSG